jgi:hypothetical protein
VSSVALDVVVEPINNPTSVYRYYDKWGLLLYVGVTGRAGRRNREHSKYASFWPYVARQEVDHFPAPAQALACEAKLIRINRPPFNTIHNAEHVAARTAYLEFVSSDALNMSPMELWRSLDKRLPLKIKGRGPRQNTRLMYYRTFLDHASVAGAADFKPSVGAPVSCNPNGLHVGQVKTVRFESGILFIEATLRPGIEISDAYIKLSCDFRASRFFINRLVVTRDMPAEEASKWITS